VTTDRPERAPSLRDRKRRRALAAIRKAALELFVERGFDEVSVTDIAERAEVGRTTFFRYFGDKQEVLFTETEQEVAEAVDGVGPQPGRIGRSLPDALASVRALVIRYVEHITADSDAYEMHQRLVNQHAELYARSLVKQRRHAGGLTRQLLDWGAEPATARQAAELGLACFYAGQAEADDDPRRLRECVDRAFDRLAEAGSGRRPG
jgi:AcrR family transcriptional regulator